ncbi:MAG: polysaccharide biosynthesis/export family protein [Candidatus Gastranaerophilaceae bacterium]|jgi:protein involved in polysaccharide export with SLBB domain
MNNKYKIEKLIIIFILVDLFFNFYTNEVFATSSKEAYVQKNVELPSLGNYNQSKRLVAREYILGANDIIFVEFLGIPELSKEFRIQPDGRISMSYMEDFHVAGKTLSQVQELIKNTYDEYLENPQINVKLIQTKPFIVYVAGAILNPGSYELNTITNQSPYISKPEAFIERKTPLLSNIVVAAGGLTHDADVENVSVTNDFDGSHFQVNLFELIKNANSSQDIYLMAGDRVYIPKLPSVNHIDLEKYKLLVSSTLFQKTIPVKVIGYVSSPGLLNLNSQQSANLTSAIAQAGGYSKDTVYYPQKVLISRADANNNEKLVTFSINPREKEFMLMPNDIVYVPDKALSKIGRVLDYASSLFSPFYLYWNTFEN